MVEYAIQIAGPAGALAVDDVGIRPESAGRLPVLLVHSLAGNTAHWIHQLEHLRLERRAIAVDLRGHGRSERPGDGDYSIAAMVADIEAAVNALNLKQFVLVGHSLGGGIALKYAGAHPERVAGLLLVDPIGDGKQIPVSEAESFLAALKANYQETIRGYWTGIAGSDSAIREQLLQDLDAIPQEAVMQMLQEMLRFDPHPSLSRYRGPMLAVVTPSNDAAFSLHRLGKGFPHRVVHDTGHWLQLNRPDELNRIMDEFLITVSGKR
jgi:pimeloyl-ACP methyl ester carboxylesterase